MKKSDWWLFAFVGGGVALYFLDKRGFFKPAVPRLHMKDLEADLRESMGRAPTAQELYDVTTSDVEKGQAKEPYLGAEYRFSGGDLPETESGVWKVAFIDQQSNSVGLSSKEESFSAWMSYTDFIKYSKPRMTLY